MRVSLLTPGGGLALAALALVLASAPACGQVAAETDLRDGVTAIEVRNPSARTMSVEIALHHGTVEDGRLVLGEPVKAVVGPKAFRLGPGEAQMVRARLREPVEPGTVLRIVTTLTPVIEREDGEAGSRGQLVLATRLITKLIVR